MYDLIGDIHGHADELVQLLQTLGYQKSKIVFRHPERQAIFLGDFIDRGPKIRQVLEIVHPMVNMGYARSVMGNHELNALAFHTEDPDSPGTYLRPHTDKNIHQHSETLRQLSPGFLKSSLNWFRTLPLWLDLPGLRVVHGCWDEEQIDLISAGLKSYGGVTTGFLESACVEGKPLFDPVEVVLKGKEMKLPNGASFKDKDGHVRTAARTRWYLSPRNQTYRNYSLTDEIDCDLELEPDVIAVARPYLADAKPVFVGHYWLSAKQPAILADNVACLDYSVAKGGFLCAYRWQGERKLRDENFVWVTK